VNTRSDIDSHVKSIQAAFRIKREKEIIKEVIVKQDESKSKMIEETLHNLRLELLSKDKKINELQTKLSEIYKSKFNMGAVYLRGSNLDETLMK
jgi:hypothetical protein